MAPSSFDNKHLTEESPMPKNPARAARAMAILPRTLAALLLVAAAGATLGSARAEYPERQIAMVACFPAGGGTDIAARLINVPARRGAGQTGDCREPRRCRRQYR